MNNDIKEILEFKENADYKRLSVDEIAILEDCITNLQEENRQTKLLKERYQLEKEDYKSKIDKAIDKLKSMLPICIMPNNMLIHGSEKAKIIEETLNILEGSDKDE